MRYLFVFIAMCLGACSGNVDRVRTLVHRADQVPALQWDIEVIELGRVSLPEYVARRQIAVSGGGTVPVTAPVAMWDKPTGEMVQAHIVQALKTQTGAVVGKAPWPSWARPEVRLELAIDQMIPRGDGRFEISGWYQIIPYSSDFADTGQKRFAVFAPIVKPDYIGVKDAQARALDLIVSRIAASLARPAQGS